MKFGIHNPSWVYGPDPAETFEAVKSKAQCDTGLRGVMVMTVGRFPISAPCSYLRQRDRVDQARPRGRDPDKGSRRGLAKSCSNSISCRSSGTTPGSSTSLTASFMDTQGANLSLAGTRLAMLKAAVFRFIRTGPSIP
jgi:hypothetical protein